MRGEPRGIVGFLALSPFWPRSDSVRPPGKATGPRAPSSTATRPSGASSRSRGAPPAYVESGEGPPVVLIHGASPLLQDMTTSIMSVLARRHRVVAFDRPRHGHSTRRPYRAWDGAQARALHEGVRRLGLRAS